MKCIQCNEEFEAKRTDAKFCSARCRLLYHRHETDNGLSVSNETDNVVNETDKSRKDETDNFTIQDLGLDLRNDLGIDKCADGVPILIRNDITVEQVQNLVAIVQARNGDFNWKPRCGFGKSF